MTKTEYRVVYQWFGYKKQRTDFSTLSKAQTQLRWLLRRQDEISPLEYAYIQSRTVKTEYGKWEAVV